MRRALVFVLILIAVGLLTVASPAHAFAWAPSYHVVRPGQTMTSIAAMYGVSSWSLAYANGIWNPNLLYVGQVLYIPSQGSAYYPRPYYPYYSYYPRPTYGCYYWVRYGDTMSRIAALYGTDPWSLARANRIYNLNWIYAGQRLFIPGCN